jgi:NhaA family Na+:H+ antiporter
MPQTQSVNYSFLSKLKAHVSSSAVLIFFTVAALICANIPGVKDWYFGLWQNEVSFSIGNFNFFSHNGHAMSLGAVINDFLMAIFFLSVGLEIKREIRVGELSTREKALLPIIGACGGMIVPVLFYYMVCHSSPEVNGVAIPMATDIAFALAVLGLLGKRVPLGMRIFLTALAVVDDIGGIIIIALFYSGEIAYQPLLFSLILLIVLFIGGKMQVNNPVFYYLLGFFVWMLFLESGVHPTIAGVLVAFTVPARPAIKLDKFTNDMGEYMELLDYTEARHSGDATVLSSKQIQILNNIHLLADQSISPLQNMADKLHPLVNYLILPLFAFVNAGVTFGDIQISALLGIPLAVFVGLFLGKSLGIYIFTYLFVRMGFATIPTGVNKRSLFGVSMLGGIGFTVALFIANLSFADMPEVGTNLLNQAKLGVFSGSLISGIVGYLILKMGFRAIKN